MAQDESLLLERIRAGDETSLKILIQRHLRQCYAFVLTLIGGDKDKTIDLTAESFAASLQQFNLPFGRHSFILQFAQCVVVQCREARILPVPDRGDDFQLPAEEKNMMQILMEAFQKLSFEEKALVLLRDLLHLAYADIAKVLEISESSSRFKVEQGRETLRRKIDEAL